MLSQRADLDFGISNEQVRLADIERITGHKMTRIGGYSIFDYANDNNTVFAELKTRRIKHNDYETAIVGLNKIRAACLDSTKTYYFCFNYTDGLYYIKYDRAMFDKFIINKKFMRSNRSDCNNDIQEIVHIPSGLLSKFV